MHGAVADLVERLAGSVGPAVYEDVGGLVMSPTLRTSWIELQTEVVSVAQGTTSAQRQRLARTLLRAVLDQPVFGPSNRLDATTFAFLFETLGDELIGALDRAVGHQWGGKRYLHQHLWALPDDAGARWLGHLITSDDTAAAFLYQDMKVGKVPMWREEDWPARIDAIAALPTRSRPALVDVLFMIDVPRVAAPALVRLALEHGTDERDRLVRNVAGRLRSLRSIAAGELDLFDWNGAVDRPGLFRWILELSSEPGDRERLVAAAASSGLLAPSDVTFLSAPLERPAWADGPVPWVVETVVHLGTITLPTGRLTAGDPWWTGGAEGFPWVVTLDAASVAVDVIIASHPLFGRQCAALTATVHHGTVEQWRLIEGTHESSGYRVQTGVAGLGSFECYDVGVIHGPEAHDDLIEPGPLWKVVDGGDLGGMALCTVGPQDQLCRTWSGLSSDGTTLRLVTDLGLLGFDPETDPTLPW